MLANARLPKVIFGLSISLGATACSSTTPDSTTGGATSTSGTVSCPAPTHGPTLHQGLKGAETWTADASPHVVPFSLSVHAKLVIEPCATVEIAGGATIEIFSDGRLEANGLAGQEIAIGRKDPKTAWGSISLGGGGSLSLENATLDGGGDPMNTAIDVGATVSVSGGSSTTPDDVLHVAHVTVSNSSSLGFALATQDPFSADSDDLTVAGSASYPMRIASNLLGSIPRGQYTGNAVDEILVPGQAVTDIIEKDMTIHERGVPYRVGDENTAGELRVAAPHGIATLTVEAGVTLRFKKAGVFTIDHFDGSQPAAGALIALGTEAAPILFTSAEAHPKAGDWLGLTFGGVPSKSRLEGVQIAFAGGASTSGSSSCPYAGEPINDAAIRIGEEPLNGVFVKHTTITDSAAHGIDRGWKGASSLDFVTPNSFARIARCKQTLPAPPSMSCPTAPPCP